VDAFGTLRTKLRFNFSSEMPDRFEELARSLDVGEVTTPADPIQPQRMNANAFCIRNRVFAMRVGEDLVLKLPPKRVAELIDTGTARPNLVGGKQMKEWANIAFSTESPLEYLAKESLAYVRDKP
jgi:hypothetical protein